MGIVWAIPSTAINELQTINDNQDKKAAIHTVLGLFVDHSLLLLVQIA
jgi:hypothetical protein